MTDRNPKAAVRRHYKFVDITSFVAGQGSNPIMEKHLRDCPQCSVCAQNVREVCEEIERTLGPSAVIEIFERENT